VGVGGGGGGQDPKHVLKNSYYTKISFSQKDYYIDLKKIVYDANRMPLLSPVSRTGRQSSWFHLFSYTALKILSDVAELLYICNDLILPPYIRNEEEILVNVVT
jgi:hypothetical protein